MTTSDVEAGAAATLRRWALDEGLKTRVLATPALAEAAGRIARRYVAGETVEDALLAVDAVTERGHRSSVEYVGESVRSAEVAETETRVFEDLAGTLGEGHRRATISLDLSHVGAVVSVELGLANGLRVAEAARRAGTSAMISAEGAGRTDLIHDLYERIAERYPETGITLQARLHRSVDDLPRLMRRPGPIRLVKGAFSEPAEVAHPRDSDALTSAYRAMAAELVGSGHRVNIATHDPALLDALRTDHGDRLREPHVEFEMLRGLGTGLLDSLRDEGFATREYLVFGSEWWLYVLHRIAEEPHRVLRALADLDHGDGPRPTP